MSNAERVDQQLPDLSQYVRLMQGCDILQGMHVYHGNSWRRVEGLGQEGGRDVWYAREAGTVSESPETSIAYDDERTYPAISGIAPVQFQDGDVVATEWPDRDLIYVRKAYRRELAGKAREEYSHPIAGLFMRRMTDDGEYRYDPVDPVVQGVSGDVSLLEGLDLILEWEPIDLGKILAEINR